MPHFKTNDQIAFLTTFFDQMPFDHLIFFYTFFDHLPFDHSTLLVKFDWKNINKINLSKDIFSDVHDIGADLIRKKLLKWDWSNDKHFAELSDPIVNECGASKGWFTRATFCGNCHRRRWPKWKSCSKKLSKYLHAWKLLCDNFCCHWYVLVKFLYLCFFCKN